MNLQQIILKKYLDLNQNPTLSKISKDTGIQLTRVFRLLNGHEMKLSEYEVFMKRLEAGSVIGEEYFDCIKYLDRKNLDEIQSLMNRKLKMNKLLKFEEISKTNAS